jgi:hypothetical protein
MTDSPQKPLKFGILGCANIARKNVRAIISSSNCILTAISSRQLSKANAFLEQNILPYDFKARDKVKIYTSYDELLDSDDVDAVYIPLPVAIKLQYVEKAAKKGKHVLIEKPAALNCYDLARMIIACHKSGVLLMDGTMFMHHKRMNKIINIIHKNVGTTDVITNLLSHSQSISKSNKAEEIHVTSNFSFNGGSDFHASNIRVSQDGDPAGALGDLGHYCIRFFLVSVLAAKYPAIHAHRCDIGNDTVTPPSTAAIDQYDVLDHLLVANDNDTDTDTCTETKEEKYGINHIMKDFLSQTSDIELFEANCRQILDHFKNLIIQQPTWAHCSKWSDGVGSVPLECDALVTLVDGSSLRFSVSFCRPFSQDVTLALPSQLPGKGDVRICMNDFVIPNCPEKAFFTHEVYPATGPLSDYDCRVMKSSQIINMNDCQQEKLMFDTFADIVFKATNYTKGKVNHSDFQKWFYVMMSGQFIQDSLMELMCAGK